MCVRKRSGGEHCADFLWRHDQRHIHTAARKDSRVSQRFVHLNHPEREPESLELHLSATFITHRTLLYCNMLSTSVLEYSPILTTLRKTTIIWIFFSRKNDSMVHLPFEGTENESFIALLRSAAPRYSTGRVWQCTRVHAATTAICLCVFLRCSKKKTNGLWQQKRWRRFKSHGSREPWLYFHITVRLCFITLIRLERWSALNSPDSLSPVSEISRRIRRPEHFFWSKQTDRTK